MKSLYFLPQWYRKKIKVEKGKKLRAAVILLLIINLILVNIFIINKNKLVNVKDKLSKSASVEKPQYHKVSTLECFLSFYEIWKGKNFKAVSIQNRNINFNVEDGENCFSLIKSIEESGKFIIKDLKCVDIAEGKKKTWQINLKLK